MNKRSKFKYKIGDMVQIDAEPHESDRWYWETRKDNTKVVGRELKSGEPYLTLEVNGKLKEVHQNSIRENE